MLHRRLANARFLAAAAEATAVRGGAEACLAACHAARQAASGAAVAEAWAARDRAARANAARERLARDKGKVRQLADAVRLCGADPELQQSLCAGSGAGAKRRELDRLVKALQTVDDAVRADERLLGQLEAVDHRMDACRAAAGAGDLQALRHALAMGCSPNEPDDAGLTAVHYACRGGHPAALQLCFEAGGDLEQQVLLHAEPPLLFAVRGGHRGVVRYLLAQGVDPDGMDPTTRRTGLHAAAEIGDAELVRELLDHGASLQARDARGDSPLHRAALRLRVAAARLLLARGAHPSARNARGEQPLDLAASALCAWTNGQARGCRPQQQQQQQQVVGLVGTVKDVRSLANRPALTEPDQDDLLRRFMAMQEVLLRANSDQNQS